MDLRLTDKQVFNAILADKEGNEAADKFEKIMNENIVDKKDEVLAGLKIIFGDIDDIDLPDFLKKL